MEKTGSTHRLSIFMYVYFWTSTFFYNSSLNKSCTFDVWEFAFNEFMCACAVSFVCFLSFVRFIFFSHSLRLVFLYAISSMYFQTEPRRRKKRQIKCARLQWYSQLFLWWIAIIARGTEWESEMVEQNVHWIPNLTHLQWTKPNYKRCLDLCTKHHVYNKRHEGLLLYG